MKKIEWLKSKIKSNIFTDLELKTIFFNTSSSQLHNFISRAIQSHGITKLKRGIYAFNGQNISLSTFRIANKLYQPSYVSFESALSFHGLIPEAVFTTTCACFQRKTKNFQTPFGQFSYQYIPVSPFFMGVKFLLDREPFLMASPLRALFDLIYVRRKNYRSIQSLEDDLRLDLEEFKQYMKNVSAVDLQELSNSYGKKTTTLLSTILIKEFE